MKSNGNKHPKKECAGDAASPVRDDIRQLKPYRIFPRHGLVKLDSMENPHQLPDSLRAGLGGVLSGVNVNRYPESDAGTLRALLIAHTRYVKDQNIMLGNGSDELIQTLVMACCGGRACEHVVMGVEPGFSMYEQITRIVGARWESVPLTVNFKLDMKRTLAEIKRHRPRLFFLASPHNPSGGIFEPDEIAEIAKAMGDCGWFVLDEAYQPYSDPGLHLNYALSLENMPHVFQLRTLSKLGMAGLRLGYLLGAPGHIKHLEKVRLPYNVNAYTQAAAAYILEHGQDWMLDSVDKVCGERSRLIDELSKIKRVRKVHSSFANFVLVEVPNAERVSTFLLFENILVKFLELTRSGHLHSHLRITVGSERENDDMLCLLEEALKAEPREMLSKQ